MLWDIKRMYGVELVDDLDIETIRPFPFLLQSPYTHGRISYISALQHCSMQAFHPLLLNVAKLYSLLLAALILCNLITRSRKDVSKLMSLNTSTESNEAE